MNVKWNVFDCPPELRDDLSRQLDIPPLVAHLLIKRGITNPGEGERFLSPLLQHLHDPFLMKDMDKGVERVLTALHQNEKIHIYGDYDVDGITACTLLVDFLGTVGDRPAYYIPHRIKEGYGLNAEAVKTIAAQGAKLLVCVDCGISDHEEIRLAQQLGIDTIIVDHHEPPPLPSPAFAVLDPLQADCRFPFKGLAGVGVAFHLLIALRRRLRERGFWSHGGEPNLRRYLDLVALGTIADIVPLRDTNRVLAMYGLKELKDTSRPGITALKEVSGIGNGEISSGQVAFRLAPRLNAGGRLTEGQKGVELLLTYEYECARHIATELDLANRERQGIEERLYQEAKAMIEQEGMLDRRSIVLSSEKWHPGVIGIVASRLVEEFWRPTILIALDGDEGKGSARSIAGFHIYEGLQECTDHLMACGGHKYAAGLKINRDEIQTFRDGFEEVVKKRLGENDCIPSLAIDAEVGLEDITSELLSYLALFPPYGAGNPRPVFSTREKIPVRDIRILRGNTLKFSLKGEKEVYEVIGFRKGDLAPHLASEMRIAFHPQMNNWQGIQRLQLALEAVETDNKG